MGLFSSPPATLCLLRLSAIGDVCNTVPVVRTLQTHWPDCRITWIIGRTEAELVDDLSGVEFITFDKGAGRQAMRDLKAQLKDRRFAALLHMQASMRANRISRLDKADIRLGFDRARARDLQWLYTNQKIAPQTNAHVLDGLFGFPAALGIEQRELFWEIPLSEVDHDFATQQLPNDQRTLLISPCSSARFRNWRNWPAERYAAVADYAIAEHDMRVVLTGGPTELERTYGASITKAMRGSATDLIGQTSLKQLLALLQRSSALLAPDSGPIHMATAVGTPVIGLFATSNPERTGPYLQRTWLINRYPEALKAELGQEIDEVKWGRRVRSPGAMELISVADVNHQLQRLLSQPNI